jgi:maleate cis-trans isomerase
MFSFYACAQPFIVHTSCMKLQNIETGSYHALKKVESAARDPLTALTQDAKHWACLIALVSMGFSVTEALEGTQACAADEMAAMAWIIAAVPSRTHRHTATSNTLPLLDVVFVIGLEQITSTTAHIQICMLYFRKKMLT